MVSGECYCSGYHSPPIPYDQGAHSDRYHLLVLSPKYSVRCSPSDPLLSSARLAVGVRGRGLVCQRRGDFVVYR